MATYPQVHSKHRSRRTFLGTLALGTLVALGGCDATDPFLVSGGGPPKPCEAPCQVVAYWQPQVVFVPDPTRGGNPGPCLAGRVHLFGPELGQPLVGDGSLVVELYDDTPRPNVTEPVLVEKWIIDAETMKRLLKSDIVGWGYTVVLPWGTYRPDLTKMRLKTQYLSAKGVPLYAYSSVALNNPDAPRPVVQTSSKMVNNAAPPVVQTPAKTR